MEIIKVFGFAKKNKFTSSTSENAQRIRRAYDDSYGKDAFVFPEVIEGPGESPFLESNDGNIYLRDGNLIIADGNLL